MYETYHWHRRCSAASRSAAATYILAGRTTCSRCWHNLQYRYCMPCTEKPSEIVTRPAVCVHRPWYVCTVAFVVAVCRWCCSVRCVGVTTQDPNAEPLMLDRFDARWMLDLADFNKGAGSSLSAKVIAEVRNILLCMLPATLFFHRVG